MRDADLARQYRDAVEEYVTAFDVAESEAIRRRRNDFSRAEQQRLGRAKRALRIASDQAATPRNVNVLSMSPDPNSTA